MQQSSRFPVDVPERSLMSCHAFAPRALSLQTFVPGHISTCHLVLTITLSLWRSAAADSGHAAVTAFVTADGSAGEVRPEFGGEAGVGGDGRSGGSLLEKYTFRETIKTGLIEAEHLRELPEFLEGIGLREKLDVSHAGSGVEHEGTGFYGTGGTTFGRNVVEYCSASYAFAG